jgi:hypothetical protein
MKKFYFLLLTMLSVMTVSAQDFAVKYNGSALANGATVNITSEDLVTSEVIPGVMNVYSMTPYFYVTGGEDGSFTVAYDITETNGNGEFQFCYYLQEGTGQCVQSNPTVVDGYFNDDTNSGFDMQYSYKGASMKPIKATVKVTVTNNDSASVSFTIVYDSEATASVSNVAKDNSVVRFANNNLYVNLDSAATVEVFSTTGSRVKVVKGVKNATINLSNLQNGIYFYRAGKKTGKFIVK